MSTTGFDDQTLSPEERLKAREGFFRLMSHEIRTPLNGVMGMLSLLERTPLSPDQASYINTARESGEHLLTLVNDLLDYARIDAGRIALEVSEVRLEPLLQSVAELLSPRAHAAGIEIAWSLDPMLGYIQADEGRLRQILFNLAGNALKFTSQGGVLIHVGLTDQGMVRFCVRDTGAGIAPEARQRIFEEFGQAEPGRDQRYGGAGLGLVVVKKLVEAMQGTLTVDSTLGEGSTFAVEFSAPFGIGGRASCPRHPHAVTLVSGNPILLQSAETHLSACGVKLRISEALGETLDPFAVIMADRATTGGPRPAPSQRSLILLAPEERDELEAWREQGWAGYLIKPLRRTSLFERIEALYDHTEETDPAATRDDERIAMQSAADKVVLLVEDNPVNALLAQILLQREGCRVERASTGEDALDIAMARQFDLIFMDLGLPGLDGIGATKALRAKGLTTPIIALTANAYEEDRRACLNAGMNDFLTKPIEIVALKAKLQAWASARTDSPARVG
jgi:CheY-like chemotaxis protein